ncbi:MAG TPA: hypothetical protein VKP69_32500, partial [Isosphaeraceae bacterium]|nr:hypothetical protein [Isosphaeraceae bacterium]
QALRLGDAVLEEEDLDLLLDRSGLADQLCPSGNGVKRRRLVDLDGFQARSATLHQLQSASLYRVG